MTIYLNIFILLISIHIVLKELSKKGSKNFFVLFLAISASIALLISILIQLVG
jgi:hypothetical protein